MKLVSLADRVIRYSFYLLLFLVPLVFTNDTSELFEFNKMWLTFILTIIVAGAWTTKVIAQKKFKLQRTPLDIPIALFLLSQIISTIFSLDTHTSLWGYYSRFNGGLLSIISYIILYYAFVSNLLDAKIIKRLLIVGLSSGAIVALWGLPSHFGYDPTCLLFRGNLDVSCWTIDFQPKLRIFSTIGQPNWLAAYINVLILPSLAFAVLEFKNKASKKFIFYSILSFIFLLDLLFTKSQSGFLGIVIALFIFAGILVYEELKHKQNDISIFVEKKHFKLLLASFAIFALTVFFVGSPIDKLNIFTYPGLAAQFTKKPVSKTATTPTTIPALELNITDSGQIRTIVWKGAFSIWQHYPIFGSGVETFAYSYYQYRPVEHNLTSEWNYLYNKAHNEYINFLATTGAFGFLTYMAVIFYFLYISFRTLLLKNDLTENARLVVLALLAGYISILVTNFFGFSVVIINIYFYLIPALVIAQLGLIDTKSFFQFSKTPANEVLSLAQKILTIIVILIAGFLIFNLVKFWFADKAYFYGSNLDQAQQFQEAYSYLAKAVNYRGDEPVFQDELALNNGILAASLISVDQTRPATQSAQDGPIIQALLQNSVGLSDKIAQEHPSNVVFMKSRVRLFYTLSQVDPKYLPTALDTIKKAKTLAPTDATIAYNLGILQGQTGDFKSAIETLENTVKLRPNYRDAHFGLALFYHQQAVDKNGRIIDSAFQEKAISEMEYILKNIDPNDQQAQQALDTWKTQ